MTVITPESFGNLLAGAWDYKSTPFQNRELNRMNNQARLKEVEANNANMLDQVRLRNEGDLALRRFDAKVNRQNSVRAGLSNLASNLSGFSGSGAGGRFAGSPELQKLLLDAGRPPTLNGQLGDFADTTDLLNRIRSNTLPWTGSTDALAAGILNNGFSQ